MLKNFENLEIRHRSRTLVKEIYLLTEKLPSIEKYGLISQIRRAAVSVPSNIAEGCGRNHTKELIQFLHIAIGSLCEIETQLFLIVDLDLISVDEVEVIRNEAVIIRKMILSYIKTL